MFLIKYILLTFLILQIIITTTTIINCLNQNDLCKRRINEKRCQILNETVVQCISESNNNNNRIRSSRNINDCDLKSEWKIKCGDSYCSKDMLTCEIFKMNMNKIEEKEKKMKKDWRDKLIIKNYLNFENDIKNCKSRNNNNNKNEIFQWKLNNLCDNQNMFACSGGRLTHLCIDLFCVSDKKVCMGFKLLLSDFSFDFKMIANKVKINKCLESNRKFL